MNTLHKATLASFLLSQSALAYAPITQDFRSTRTAGMGGVRYTTGEYEENFFANPARSADNPGFQLQLMKLTVETSSGTISSIGNLLKSHSGLSGFSGIVGQPQYARFQLIPIAVHFKNFIDDKWSMGAGLFLSAQTNPSLSQSGQIDPATAVAAGPVLNVSRRLLEEDRLVVGMNFRTEVRATSNNAGLSVQDFLSGANLSNSVKGGSGFGFDFDLGTTFKPHWKNFDFEYELGFAINNVLGGKYKNISRPIKSWDGDPAPANRTFNFGLKGTRKDIFGLDQITLALETTDIGNNPNGSLYRTIHMGTEIEWKILRARAGLNQGYLAAGLGIDLFILNLDFATYGEELSLNPGIAQDRRYILDLGFKI